MRSLIRITLVTTVVMLGLSGAAFAQQASTKFPGSLLVFPKFIRGSTGANAATTFEIGVVCPSDTSPGQCTQLRLTSIDPNLTQAKMGTKGLVDSSGPAVVADTFASEVSLIVLGILALGWLALRRRPRTRAPLA